MVVAETRRDRPPPASLGTGDALDTFPKLLFDLAARRGDRPAMREKDYGIWQSWRWAEVAREVEDLASGFGALGLERGDRIAVIGDNRPLLYWSITAAQCLGAVPVPVYQDAVAEEMAYVLAHAEARFIIAEDQEQVDKLLAIRDRLPRLEAILYVDPRGLRHYRDPSLHALAAVKEQGRDARQDGGAALRREIAAGRGGDLAIILYTSGTTGPPKGVMLTFDNVIRTARNACARDGLGPGDEVMAYLPMAWVGDHVFSFAQSYCTGFCVSCPESAETVMADLREIGPTYFFAPPRIWEGLLTRVMIRMEDAGPLKRRLFDRAIALARRVGVPILDGSKGGSKGGAGVGLLDRLGYALAAFAVYGPLKNALGMSRIRLAYTAGEAIGPDTFLFFRSLGLNIKQLYGSTEAAVFISMQPDDAVRPDTVGTPAPEVEVTIAEDGEVLYRGPGVFAGYYKDPAATAAAKRPDGWVHSGDAGFFTAEGQLRIIDRAKDVGRLADGTLFAPKYLENKLKFFPWIREAVAFGMGRATAAAFINIDMGAVGSWAERRGITYGGYQELAGLGAVHDLVREAVEAVNRDLAREPDLRGSQIRRFLILPKELDADDGELTRTRKVRRRFIAERYAPLVEALYDEREQVEIETEVIFEDGRKGRVKAALRIGDAAVVAASPGLKR